MIYQRFGRWWGLFSFVDLQFLNFLTLVTEFAAIALALSKMNIDPKIGVPIAAVTLVALVMTGSYRRWERTVVFLCLLDSAWLLLAVRLHPGLPEVVRHSLIPEIPAGGACCSGDSASTVSCWAALVNKEIHMLSQETKYTQAGTNEFLVIHPLDDVREQKVDTQHLGPMRMTRSTRNALFALRVYLAFMTALVLWHVFTLAR